LVAARPVTWLNGQSWSPVPCRVSEFLPGPGRGSRRARHVVLAEQATHLVEQLRRRGFEPIGVDLSELMKSGGSAKCCTLELRAR